GKLQALMADERMKHTTMVEQSHDELIHQMNEFVTTYEHLSKKMDDQITKQQIIIDQMSTQAETQDDLNKRLENQEALTEKLLRQVDHLRSILFERVSFLAEK